MKETTLKYVPHGQVPVMLKEGWTVVHGMADNHHGEYSVIMRAPERQTWWQRDFVQSVAAFALAVGGVWLSFSLVAWVVVR